MDTKEPEKQPEKKSECSGCSYYHSAGGKSGHCRRYPPRVASVPKTVVHKSTHDEYGIVAKTEWPVVAATDWCGEFKEN
jgi:hypothetical protein